MELVRKRDEIELQILYSEWKGAKLSGEERVQMERRYPSRVLKA